MSKKKGPKKPRKPYPKPKKQEEDIEPSDEERRAHMEAEGMDTFFAGDSYIPAHPDEFEGHYPGNQNNPVVIPYQQQVSHVTES